MSRLSTRSVGSAKVYVVLFLSCAAVILLVAMLSRREPSAEEQLHNLRKAMDNRQFLEMDIYYFSWLADVEEPVTPDSLMRTYQYKISARFLGEVGYRIAQDISKLNLADAVPIERDDFRLACILYANEKVVFRIYFQTHQLAARTGESSYRIRPSLLEAFLPCLPDSAQACLREYLSGVSEEAQTK